MSRGLMGLVGASLGATLASGPGGVRGFSHRYDEVIHIPAPKKPLTKRQRRRKRGRGLVR